MRKTKIVATLGPASDDIDILQTMITSGLDVARLNFSHGEHSEHTRRVDRVRQICNDTGSTVALMADMKGPEVRLGMFQNGKAELIDGATFTLTVNDITGDASRSSVSYANLPNDVKPGVRILLDDGLIELVVESIIGTEIHTRVVIGGIISNRKGVNIPDVKLDLPYISAHDRADLRFIVESGFDIIAASFVRGADDIREIREEINRIDSKNEIRIIAKIESSDGVRNADAILAVSDGLMVARGDLGVEVAYEELPIIQKSLISKAVMQGKPVITATQMLESMVKSPRPTRAETSDVANAIYDGTSAIMLSGETAAGKYPLQSFIAMSKIAERIERDIDYYKQFSTGVYKAETSVTNAIAHATVTASHELRTAAIVTVSITGNTARNVAKFRPTCPIIACTPNPTTQRQLKLAWGVIPLLTVQESATAELFDHAIDAAVKGGYLSAGDLVVLTAGIPVGFSGTTNMLKVHVVGEKVFVS